MIRQDQIAKQKKKRHRSYNRKSLSEDPSRKGDSIRYYLQCLYNFLDSRANEKCVLLDGNAKMTIDTFRRTCRSRRRLARIYARKKLLNTMDKPYGEDNFDECLRCTKWKEALTSIPDWLKPHIIDDEIRNESVRHKDSKE